MVTGIVGFVAIAVLSYVFAGILSYIPYFLGLLVGFIDLPLNLISAYIYPVGDLPYVMVIGGLSFIIIITILSLIFGGKS